jgi:hypothetical protein
MCSHNIHCLPFAIRHRGAADRQGIVLSVLCLINGTVLKEKEMKNEKENENENEKEGKGKHTTTSRMSSITFGRFSIRSAIISPSFPGRESGKLLPEMEAQSQIFCITVTIRVPNPSM